MIAGSRNGLVLGGAVAALAAAFCWTLASFLWRRLPTSLSAAQLNLLKNSLALLLQLPLCWLVWQPLSLSALLLLSASGLLGIALGDSLFFAALRRLGARRTLTVEAAGPALTTLAALLLLSEWPDRIQILGLVLIAASVVLVAQRQDPAADQTASHHHGVGLLLVLAALVCGSAGALLARQVFIAASVSPWQAAAVRLAAATLVQLPWVPALWRRAVAGLGPRPATVRWPLVLMATLLGTTLGIGLQQTALARLPAGEAVSLMATAPTMAVLLAPLDRDRPGLRGFAAALLALLGVLLMVAG